MRKPGWGTLFRAAGVFLFAVALLAVVAACGQKQSASLNQTGSQTNADKGKAQPVELKLSHFMSSEHVQDKNVMRPWAEEVEKATGGRVKITIFPGGALGKPNDQYDAAVTGITDIAFGVQSYTPGRFPATSVMQLPYMAGSALNGSLMLWDLYEKFPAIGAEYKGVKVLWLWTGDPGQLLTRKPVRAVSDLKGMKLRSPAVEENALIESWGATPISMPMSDVYEAMQKGVVDGAFAPLSTIVDFKLYQVAKYLTIGNFFTSPMFVVMNPNAWNKIQPEDQKAIEKMIGLPMTEKAAKEFDRTAQSGLELAQKNNLDVYFLKGDELAKWQSVSKPIAEKWVDSMEAKGIPARELYEEALRLQSKYK